MKVVDGLIIVLLIVILSILLKKRQVEGFTTSDVTSFGRNSFIAAGVQNSIPQFCDVMIAELLNDGTAFTKLNNFISATNTQHPALNSPLFTSVDDYNQVFTTAFNSGESAFATNVATSKRNKMTLRTYAAACIEMVNSIPPGLFTIQYDSNGKPTFTDEVVITSGKSINDILTLGFRTIKDFYTQNPTGGTTPASTLAMINDILPSNIPKYETSVELDNEFKQTTNPSARMIFIVKAYVIGFAYIAWLAEHKWRLDPAWSFTS